MSRIGKQPVEIPSGVKVEVTTDHVRVEGPKGKLSLDQTPFVAVATEGNKVICTRTGEERNHRAMHGLIRNLIRNMVEGVSKGFEKKLEIVGVGYNASLSGKTIALTVGFCKPIKLNIPTGVEVKLPDATHIVVSGADKQQVGHFAAVIRSVRKPEPYKGTGIRYEGEVVRRKSGKAFGSGG